MLDDVVSGHRAKPMLVQSFVVSILVPIMFMVLPPDVMMSAVFMVNKRGAERARFKDIAFLQLLLAAVLTLVWHPYFRAIVWSNRLFSRQVAYI